MDDFNSRTFNKHETSKLMHALMGESSQNDVTYLSDYSNVPSTPFATEKDLIANTKGD